MISEHPLLSGRTCIESCDASCCYNTEMLLTPSDLLRISKKTGLKINDFSFINQDGMYQLKNIDGHCVFLDHTTKKCSIQEFKPSGCRVYPIIFDLDQGMCVIDKFCPQHHKISPETLVKYCPHTKKIIEELFKYP